MSHDPPDEMVELTTRPNELDAGLIRGVLEAAGIESAQRVSGSGTLGVFGASAFNPTVVLVRRDQLDAAREALRARRDESVDIDWSEVDVGEAEDQLAARIARGEGPGPRRGSKRWVWALVAVVAAASVATLAGPWGLMAVLVGSILVAAWTMKRGGDGGYS